MALAVSSHAPGLLRRWRCPACFAGGVLLASLAVSSAAGALPGPAQSPAPLGFPRRL